MGTASPREIMSTRSLRVPFLIILVVHIGQQANGINCVLFYAASIFEQVKLVLLPIRHTLPCVTCLVNKADFIFSQNLLTQKPQ